MAGFSVMDKHVELIHNLNVWRGTWCSYSESFGRPSGGSRNDGCKTLGVGTRRMVMSKVKWNKYVTERYILKWALFFPLTRPLPKTFGVLLEIPRQVEVRNCYPFYFTKIHFYWKSIKMLFWNKRYYLLYQTTPENVIHSCFGGVYYRS